jgi:hypothetical protein
MPTFAPQPSATTLYCKGIFGQDLDGLNDKSKRPKVGGKFYSQSFSRLKLNFADKEIIISSGSQLDGKHSSYGGGFSYKILNDDPMHFFAIFDRTKEMDTLQTIALDRITGTLIWTTLSASFPGMPGHPYSGSTFYVCSPNDD